VLSVTAPPGAVRDRGFLHRAGSPDVEKTRGNTWPGLMLVLAGVPVYLLWKRRQTSARANDGP
jgi:hypothetical protein